MLRLFVLDKIEPKIVLEDFRLCLRIRFENFNARINNESSFPAYQSGYLFSINYLITEEPVSRA